jgi:hypothetical protein
MRGLIYYVAIWLCGGSELASSKIYPGGHAVLRYEVAC